MKKLMLAMSAAILAAPLAANAATASWTGPYVGINAGYGLGATSIDDQDCNISCSSQHFTPSGFTIGGGAGYNYQLGSAVIGVEGDYNYIHAKTHVTSDWPSIYDINTKSYGTIRARAGLAMDRTLVYATAGLGIVNQDVTALEPNSNPALTPRYGFTRNATDVGLAAGVGAEYQESAHLRLKLEYLYVGLPAKTGIQDQYTCTTHTYCNYGVKSDINLVRVGLNYAF